MADPDKLDYVPMQTGKPQDLLGHSYRQARAYKGPMQDMIEHQRQDARVEAGESWDNVLSHPEDVDRYIARRAMNRPYDPWFDRELGCWRHDRPAPEQMREQLKQLQEKFNSK